MKGANANAKDKEGMTALMHAALLGKTEVAELLLKNGARFNSKNDDDVLTIMLAEMGGHKETAQLLRSYIVTRYKVGNTTFIDNRFSHRR